jgi:excisionase family DNA binding protein
MLEKINSQHPPMKVFQYTPVVVIIGGAGISSITNQERRVNEYLTATEAAVYTGRHVNTITRWIDVGKIHASKVGRSYQIRREDLDRFRVDPSQELQRAASAHELAVQAREYLIAEAAKRRAALELAASALSDGDWNKRVDQLRTAMHLYDELSSQAELVTALESKAQATMRAADRRLDLGSESGGLD